MPSDAEAAGGRLHTLEPGLLDTRAARARAIVDAIRSYPAIDAPAPPLGEVVAALPPTSGAADAGLLGDALLAGAVGLGWPAAAGARLAPRAALDTRLAEQILRECWLGPSLVAAVCDREARWWEGPGAIEGLRLGPAAQALLGPMGRPCALIAHRPRAEVLFLVVALGLSGRFEHVITPEDVPADSEDLDGALRQEAARRLRRSADAAAPSGGQSSRIARLSKRV